MKDISIIVAIASDGGIGKDNRLLCHIPGDLKRFRQITTGHTVIMGRNTFLSLPSGPLKNRRNIVITNIPGESFDGCECVDSIQAALDICDNNKENFVIGGASIYRHFLPLASRLYLTLINKSFDADTYFPEIDYDEWEELSSETIIADESHNFSYTYLTLKRKTC